MLQVLYVSVLCGFALSWMGQAGKPLTDLIGTASQMFFRIVAIVMWAAPIGAFGAMAFTVGKFGAGSLVSLGKLLASFYVTCPGRIRTCDLQLRRLSRKLDGSTRIDTFWGSKTRHYGEKLTLRQMKRD